MASFTVTVPVELELTPRSRAVMDALYKAIGTKFQDPDQAAPVSTTSVPRIGDLWPGQGGIYAGVARGRYGEPDYHLILCAEVTEQEFTWKDALAHAKTIEADGHQDFTVPTRWESALLYANLQDKLETSGWQWTSTQYSEGNAWCQNFTYGRQDYNDKNGEFRVRFVRRLPL